MKQLLVFFLFLSITVAGNTQEKYVEVIVTDTLLVEPQEWTLYLNIEKRYDYTMADTVVVNNSSGSTDTSFSTAIIDSRPGMQQEDEGTSVGDLSMLVKKHGGRILDEGQIPGSLFVPEVRFSSEAKSMYVSFTNRRSMEAFAKELKKFDDVQSRIINTTNSRVQDFQINLERKLMNSAKQKASRLAELGGGRLGTVLMISEVTESEGTSLKSFLESMIKMDFDRRNVSQYLTMDKIKLEKSLKVRFAIL